MQPSSGNPTAGPTSAPSVAPSGSPSSVAPGFAPSGAPTAAPTTRAPSAQGATLAPTATPTTAPSYALTSAAPTSSPSGSPTSVAPECVSQHAVSYGTTHRVTICDTLGGSNKLGTQQQPNNHTHFCTHQCCPDRRAFQEAISRSLAEWHPAAAAPQQAPPQHPVLPPAVWQPSIPHCRPQQTRFRSLWSSLQHSVILTSFHTETLRSTQHSVKRTDPRLLLPLTLTQQPS